MHKSSKLKLTILGTPFIKLILFFFSLFIKLEPLKHTPKQTQAMLEEKMRLADAKREKVHLKNNVFSYFWLYLPDWLRLSNKGNQH